MADKQPHGRRGVGVLQRRRVRKPKVTGNACPVSGKGNRKSYAFLSDSKKQGDLTAVWLWLLSSCQTEAIFVCEMAYMVTVAGDCLLSNETKN